MRPKLEQMSLRERIGQTGLPGPGEVRKGVQALGGYDAYFSQYPFAGLYMDGSAVRPDGTAFRSPAEMSRMLHDASASLKVPLLVCCDAELGGKAVFESLHRISANMSVGAAGIGELAYKRSYYWAKEMRSCGVNWVLGPVLDGAGNFFSPGTIRSISGDPHIIEQMIPFMIRGIHDAGVAACAKHFPGGGNDYRDSHFSSRIARFSREEWFAKNSGKWMIAAGEGVDSVMISHSAVPGFDASFARPGVYRPASASKRVVDILRRELGFQGVILPDAVSMKGLASAFEHEDVYIECLNAGNDLVLFCRSDYIDVIEKAVLDGRVSEERVNEACSRVLAMKEKLGLFAQIPPGEALTEAENAAFEQVIYDIGRHAITLLNNKDRLIPIDPKTVRNAAIINVAPYAGFLSDLDEMVQALQARGICTRVLPYLRSKDELIELSQTQDLIIYACFLAQGRPQGMSFYSRKEDMSTLFHGLSFGASKSVVASFGAPSIYYNYFENAGTYLNAYSSDAGTMRAFVDGIFGEFPFTGKSPVALRPVFVSE